MGVYNCSAEAGGTRDAPSPVTLTHTVQCQLIPLMESDTAAHSRWTYSPPTARQRAVALLDPERPHFAAIRRCRLEIVPAVQCYTWYSDGEWERNMCMSNRENDYALLPKTPQNASHLAPGATPRCVVVCHSLIYHAEKGDTPYIP